MNRLLLKLLAGAAVVLTSLFLVSLLLYYLFNIVRYEQYWAEHSEVLMKGIQHYGAPETIHVHPVYAITSRLDDLTLERLYHGQTVVTQEHDVRRAYQYVDGIVWYIEFDEANLSLSAYYAAMALHISKRVAYESQEWGDLIRDLGMRELASERVELAMQSHLVLSYLANENVYLTNASDRPVAYLRLESGEVVALALPAAFDPQAWPILAMILSIVMAGIFGAITLLVLALDYRLRPIETVASRIARGELDARVKTDGQSDAISRLGTAFNSMADHIHRLMVIQKEMIHAVSHELRTPVARIRFGVQMIEDCPSDEALEKQVVDIDTDIQELDDLIDEILTYARLEQGGPVLAFQNADIQSIVEQVVMEQSSVKPHMKIESQYEGDSIQWKESEVETRYIHRAIQNLVGNAVRYADSQILVACAFDKETCRVDVQDDGPGIPEEDWESVFTPFARLDDSRTRSSGGYGLGLSIVRRILYWHGGHASLGRSHLGGAKFTLVWPRKQPKY